MRSSGVSDFADGAVLPIGSSANFTADQARRLFKSCCVPNVTVTAGHKYVAYKTSGLGFTALAAGAWVPLPRSIFAGPTPGPDTITVSVVLPPANECRVIGANLLAWEPSGSGPPIFQNYISQVQSSVSRTSPARLDPTSAALAVDLASGGSPASVDDDISGTVLVNSGFGLSVDKQDISVAFHDYPLTVKNRRVQGLLNVGVLSEPKNQLTLYTYDITVEPSMGWPVKWFIDSPVPAPSTPQANIALKSVQVLLAEHVPVIFADLRSAAQAQTSLSNGLNCFLDSRSSFVGLGCQHIGRNINLRIGRINGLPVSIGDFMADSSGFQYDRPDVSSPLPYWVNTGGVQGANNAFFPGIT